LKRHFLALQPFAESASPGFGIDLWLSPSLAELMSGSITVVGKPGAASLFTVSSPITLGKIHE
jgi:hypothetical protein